MEKCVYNVISPSSITFKLTNVRNALTNLSSTSKVKLALLNLGLYWKTRTSTVSLISCMQFHSIMIIWLLVTLRLLILMVMPVFLAIYLRTLTSRLFFVKIVHHSSSLILKIDYVSIKIKNSYQIQLTKTYTLMEITMLLLNNSIIR